MSTDVDEVCSWGLAVGATVALLSALLFVLAVRAYDRALAWTSAVLFAGSSVVVAGCAWELSA